jgi:hypothetical protein
MPAFLFFGKTSDDPLRELWSLTVIQSTRMMYQLLDDTCGMGKGASNWAYTFESSCNEAGPTLFQQ